MPLYDVVQRDPVYLIQFTPMRISHQPVGHCHRQNADSGTSKIRNSHITHRSPQCCLWWVHPLPSRPPLPPRSLKPPISSPSLQFCHLRMFYKWNLTVCHILVLIFTRNNSQLCQIVVCVSIVYPFLLLSNISWNGFITVCLTIYPLKNWVLSHWGLL